jgi:hypothetical protein
MYSATSTRSRLSPPTLALPALWNECKQILTSWDRDLTICLQLWRQLNVVSWIYYFMSFECLKSLMCLASLVVPLVCNLKELSDGKSLLRT